MDRKEKNRKTEYTLREECGVVGIYSFSKLDVAPMIYRALIALQHRGQDSAGIATTKEKRIILHRELGLVSNIFDAAKLAKLAGHVGIGHVRYPTIGAGGPEDTQPFLEDQPFGGLALGANCNIANYGTARARMEAEGRKFHSTCDAELMLAVFAKHLKEGGHDVFSAVSKYMDELDGAYSVCAITAHGELIVFRDPNAIRPLCWGQNEHVIMFASESVALDINGVPLKGDVAPGEVLIINGKGVQKKIVAKSPHRRHCMFEYVYFSRPDSIEEERLIYDVRYELGRRLARQAPVAADMVVPVPDTSRPAAEGYAHESGIRIVEGLMKNRYIGRTFIMPNQGKRHEAVKLKLNAVRGLVGGKRIVLIDDSIVRGTTSGPIVKLLHDAGAKEVHLRISCPPIISPCFYGVDLPTIRELIAANKSIEEIRQFTGADSLAYLTIEDLIGSIGKARHELCLGCLTGDYPTEFADKIAKMLKEKDGKDGVRAWEEKII